MKFIQSATETHFGVNILIGLELSRESHQSSNLVVILILRKFPKFRIVPEIPNNWMFPNFFSVFDDETTNFFLNFFEVLLQNFLE